MASAVVSGLWQILASPDQVADLVQRWGLQTEEKNPDWILENHEGVWTLKNREGRKLCIDFDGEGPDYRRRAPKGRSEILAKAMGRNVRQVVDLSAGLAQDAVFLSQLGFQVTAVERHPVIAFLLQQARLQTQRGDLQSLKIVNEDSRRFLDFLEKDVSFEAAYFDPMYPTKKKSALPRQEMVIFRDLIGGDQDAEEVARAALEKVQRLVVKRPSEAPPLIPQPVHVFEGSKVRYDVYAR